MYYFNKMKETEKEHHFREKSLAKNPKEKTLKENVHFVNWIRTVIY